MPGLSKWVERNFEIRYLGSPLLKSDRLRVRVFCSNVFPIVDNTFCSEYPNLEFVVSPTTGLTHIDSHYLQENSIHLISLKGRKAFLKEITSTSEFAWGLLLSVWRKIPAATSSQTYRTEIRGDFISRQLKGRDIGIIGLGRIGSKVSEYALAFGMRVHFFDPYLSPVVGQKANELTRHTNVDSLISSVDVVLVSASVIEEDKDRYPLINQGNIELMRKDSVIINISRGIFVEELALKKALINGNLFGVGLDVLSSEEFGSTVLDGNLFQLKSLGYNLVITPHIGGMSSDALTLCISEVVKDLENCWTEKSQ
jgi:D-3-phosphoglycerate dehydrogenase